MSTVRWNATVVDSPDSEPYTVVGDLVVAVRTPRSRDFVTVEVAPSSQCEAKLARSASVLVSARPFPVLTDTWQGEVHIGRTVRFQVAGAAYRLTLANLQHMPEALPWITCEFCLERD